MCNVLGAYHHLAKGSAVLLDPTAKLPSDGNLSLELDMSSRLVVIGLVEELVEYFDKVGGRWKPSCHRMA